MTTATATHLRSVITGAAAWLVATALPHWLPLPLQLDSRFTLKMAALVLGNCSFFTLAVYLLVRRKPTPERFPAAAAIVMPVAFGDGFAMAFFKDFFPRVNPDAGAMFAALLLLTSAVILATGLVAGLRTTRG